MPLRKSKEIIMSFPEIHFGDINQYATKIDETNANKKVFILIDENIQNWLSHFQVSTFKNAFVLVLKPVKTIKI